jgi:hypothetical protein
MSQMQNENAKEGGYLEVSSLPGGNPWQQLKQHPYPVLVGIEFLFLSMFFIAGLLALNALGTTATSVKVRGSLGRSLENIKTKENGRRK